MKSLGHILFQVSMTLKINIKYVGGPKLETPPRRLSDCDYMDRWNL